MSISLFIVQVVLVLFIPLLLMAFYSFINLNVDIQDELYTLFGFNMGLFLIALILKLGFNL